MNAITHHGSIELMTAEHAVARAKNAIAAEHDRHNRAAADLQRDLALADAVLSQTLEGIPVISVTDDGVWHLNAKQRGV